MGTRKLRPCYACKEPFPFKTGTEFCMNCRDSIRSAVSRVYASDPDVNGGRLTTEQLKQYAHLADLGSYENELRGEREDPKNYAVTVRLSGNVAVFSDIHVPYQDEAWLARMFRHAVRNGCRKAIFAGDTLDFEEISRFSKARQGEEPLSPIKVCARFLKAAVKSFPDGIWLTRGNHEIRLVRGIEAAINARGWAASWLAKLEVPHLEGLDYTARYTAILEYWTRDTAGDEVAKLIHWLPDATIEVDGPEGFKPWRIIHQRPGSRNATLESNNLMRRHLQPIVTTHTHVSGARFSDDQEHMPMVNIGCATNEDWHRYAHEEPGSYPHWQNAALFIVRGRGRYFVNSPYWDNGDGEAARRSA